MQGIGSGIVYSAADVLGKCVLCGMRGFGRVCEMCMCLTRAAVGEEGCEWMRGLGLDFDRRSSVRHPGGSAWPART